MSEPKATTTQYKRRYMSVKIYHPFEDFFQDPDGAEGIARRRWRKYAGGKHSHPPLAQGILPYYNYNDAIYRAKPELDRSEDESEEAITASIKDPTRFNDDKKRNFLMMALFLNRRIPEYLKDNGVVVFAATSTGSAFQALAREICQQEPKLRGTTSKDLAAVYNRIVEMAEKLSRILETDTETGWRGSFRKTVFSEAAEKLANLDRGFRGKKRVLRLEYIGPETADVIALQEEEEREKLPRTRGRERRETGGGGSGGHSSNTTITVVIPTAVEAKEEKAEVNKTRKRKRAVKSPVISLAEPKRAARQDTLYRPQPAAVASSFSSSGQLHHQQPGQEEPQPGQEGPQPAAVASSLSSSRQLHHQQPGQEGPQPAAVASSFSSSGQLHHQQPGQEGPQPGQEGPQPAIPDEKGDEDDHYNSDIDCPGAHNIPDQRATPLPRSSSLRARYSGPIPLSTASDSRYVDPHRHKRVSVQVAGWSHDRVDRGSRSTAPPNPARGPNAYNQRLRRTTRSGFPRFNRLQSTMLAFRQDMDAQMVELTAILRDQKAQLGEFHRKAEDIMCSFPPVMLLFTPALNRFSICIPLLAHTPIYFEIVFADPPDADKLLKLVLSKESVHALESNRGSEISTDRHHSQDHYLNRWASSHQQKSTWNLGMLVISEVAAVMVVDLDRQLAVEQQLQLQSTESTTLTPNRNYSGYGSRRLWDTFTNHVAITDEVTLLTNTAISKISILEPMLLAQ
ncbi:hypothetical protein BGX30_002513 [Mortierella sp. GBA39]|nr:hypothetical protein BGX30_002513 [Mortierella sp. GBA39]